MEAIKRRPTMTTYTIHLPNSEETKVLKSEINELRKILTEIEADLRRKTELLSRFHKQPLSDERVYALYRHSLDWRQLARDIEKEHGVGEFDTSVVTDDVGYDE